MHSREGFPFRRNAGIEPDGHMKFTLCFSLTSQKAQEAGVPLAAETEFTDGHPFTENFEAAVREIFLQVESGEPRDKSLSWLGLEGTLERIWVARISPRVRLARREPALVYCFEIDFATASEEDLRERVARERTQWAREMAPLLRSFAENLRLEEWCSLKKVAALRPAVSHFFADPGEIHQAVVHMYFHLGWWTYLRLERSITSMQDLEETSGAAGLAAWISRQRVMLINLDRFFLIEDRSNQPVTKALCEKLVQKFRLKDRYARILRVHEQMERQLGNLQGALNERRTRTINRCLGFLTFIGLPVSILMGLLAVSLDASSVLKDWASVVGNPRVGLLFLASIAATLLGMGMFLLALELVVRVFLARKCEPRKD